ncbi:hypothetical protein P8452_76665 [Trifolium repens]|nr:hypothetical protein P8452_76665 [Trifolium repens]
MRKWTIPFVLLLLLLSLFLLFADQGQKFQANAEGNSDELVDPPKVDDKIGAVLMEFQQIQMWLRGNWNRNRSPRDCFGALDNISFGTSGVLHLLCVSVPIMCAAGFILVPAPPSWRNFHIFLYPSLMLCYYLVDFLNSHHRKCLAQHHLINLKKAVIATQCAWRGKVAWRELRNLICFRFAWRHSSCR